jgi:hypothetical protein
MWAYSIGFVSKFWNGVLHWSFYVCSKSNENNLRFDQVYKEGYQCL